MKIEDEEPMDDNQEYRKLIGMLLYISVSTRPDIAASVSILNQHNAAAAKVHWNELKRIVRYLKGYKDMKLKLGSKNENVLLTGYADVDWAQNNKDGKSNSGYVFKVNGATVSWACKKEDCVALSSTEAEYIALAEASQEGIWLQRLLQDFGRKQDTPVQIKEDNQSCLKLADNKKFSNRTKHIATKYHYVKDMKEKGLIGYTYCPTEKMLADMLTKPLYHVKLLTSRKECGLI